ncbi:hypothetical protein AAY473_026958 [Plecturocebus cupreus]
MPSPGLRPSSPPNLPKANHAKVLLPPQLLHVYLLFISEYNTSGKRKQQNPNQYEFKISLANVENPISTQNIKISWAWWHMPIIPATQEAEAEDSLEPGRQRNPMGEIQDCRLLAAQDCSSQRKRTEREDATFSDELLLLMD